jgi:methylmalonyl-CoA mutase C-terminal domain/subunit
VVGISLLSGAHMSLVPRILEKLRGSGASDVAVVVGGVIPDEDVEELRGKGVADVFPQDTPPDVIVTRIRELAAARPLE